MIEHLTNSAYKSTHISKKRTIKTYHPLFIVASKILGHALRSFFILVSFIPRLG